MNPTKTVWDPDARVVVGSGDLLIATPTLTTRLPDHALRDFLDQLSRTAGDLSALRTELQDDPQRAELLSAVERLLLDSGLLVDAGACQGLPAGVVASLSNRSGGQRSPAEVADRLRSATVALIGTGTALDILADTLAEYGLSRIRRFETPDAQIVAQPGVTVVQANDVYDPILRQWNEASLSNPTGVWVPFLPPHGSGFSLGPWFYPGGSACYECFMIRRGSNALSDELAETVADGVSLATPSPSWTAQPGTLRAEAGLLADDVVQHLALNGVAGQAIPGGMMTVVKRLFGHEITTHRVLRVPRCPVCSPTMGTGYPQIWFHDEGALK